MYFCNITQYDCFINDIKGNGLYPLIIKDIGDKMASLKTKDG